MALEAREHRAFDILACDPQPGTNIFRSLSKERPEDEIIRGSLILSSEGRIFFANAGQLANMIRRQLDIARGHRTQDVD